MKKYQIIYSDPPWNFKTYSEKGKEKKSAENHYKTMDKVDIQNLDVASITDKDAVLFLWVTFPCLEEGMELIKKWGFKYKTVAFTWIKKNKKADTPFMGLGYYTRANAEICLLATKGKPLQRISKSVPQVIYTPLREHSRKPDEARERIVQLFGDLPRLEMFARQNHRGWGVFGNECKDSIEIKSI